MSTFSEYISVIYSGISQRWVGMRREKDLEKQKENAVRTCDQEQGLEDKMETTERADDGTDTDQEEMMAGLMF